MTALNSANIAPAPVAQNLPPRYGAPLDLQQAKTIMAAAEAEAQKNAWPMVIAIVDSTGHLVMLQRLDHAQYASVAIAQAKAETAVNFRRATRAFEEALAGGTLRLLSMPGMTALEGGVPILVSGEVVGAIGVSGMLPAQDAQVALAGVAAIA